MVAGAKDGIELPPPAEGPHELQIRRIPNVDERPRRLKTVNPHRRESPGDPGIYRRGRERAHDIGQTPQSKLDEVLGEQVAPREVIDTHQIIGAAVRKGAEIRSE